MKTRPTIYTTQLAFKVPPLMKEAVESEALAAKKPVGTWLRELVASHLCLDPTTGAFLED